MATTLAELQVQLDMESAKFRAEISKVQASVGKLHASVAKSGDGVKASMQKVEASIQKSGERMRDALTKAFSFAAIAAAGQQLFAFAKQGADAADKMRDFSQSIGLPVEELSRLGYAAQLSGASSDEMHQGLTRLSAKLADAAGGSKEAAAIFAAMGIKTKDASGNLRGAGEVLAEVADRFASYKDGAAKAALAQDIFGKSGARLIPTLNNGSKGLKELGEEADRFGYTMQGAVVEGAARFNDALDKMQLHSTNAGAALASALAPAVEGVVKAFERNSAVGDAFKLALAAVEVVAKNTAGQILKLSFALDALASAGGVALSFAVNGPVDALAHGVSEAEALKKRMQVLNEDLAKVFGTTGKAFGPEFRPDQLGKKKEAPIVSQAKKAEDDLKKSTESLRGLRYQLQKELATLGLGKTDKLSFDFAFDKELKKDLDIRFKGDPEGLRLWREEMLATTKGIEDTEAAMRRMEAVHSKVVADITKHEEERLAILDEVKRAQEELLTPSERYVKALEDIALKADKAKLSEQQTATLRKKALADLGDDLAEFKRTGTELTESLFDAFASNIQDGFGSAMKAVEQSFAQAILRMLAQAAAANLARALFGDEKSSGLLSVVLGGVKNAFGGKRAAGGPVGRARQYLVGEEGPELFVPDASGRIIPAEQTAALMARGEGSQRVELVLPPQAVHMTLGDLIERYYASHMARR